MNPGALLTQSAWNHDRVACHPLTPQSFVFCYSWLLIYVVFCYHFVMILSCIYYDKKNIELFFFAKTWNNDKKKKEQYFESVFGLIDI